MHFLFSIYQNNLQYKTLFHFIAHDKVQNTFSPVHILVMATFYSTSFPLKNKPRSSLTSLTCSHVITVIWLFCCHTLITLLSAWLQLQSPQRIHCNYVFLLPQKCFVRSVDTLWMSSCSAGLTYGSQRRHAGNLDSRCPESTRPKDKPARHTKPGALIIQSGDGCLWQINVFYYCTPLQFQLQGEENISACLFINMHFIPSAEQTPV